MVITKDFVFIHMPKTGGTFVTEMLRKVYLGYRWRSDESIPLKVKCRHLRDRFLRRLSLSPWVDRNKHGSCNDIPRKYKSLPILGCVRNPFEWYVSSYEYQWWKRHPEEYPGLADNPDFPNLSFGQFLQLQNKAWLTLFNPGVAVDPTIGRFTTLFINFYFRRPNEILQSVANLESKERIANIKSRFIEVPFAIRLQHTQTRPCGVGKAHFTSGRQQAQRALERLLRPGSDCRNPGKRPFNFFPFPGLRHGTVKPCIPPAEVQRK